MHANIFKIWRLEHANVVCADTSVSSVVMKMSKIPEGRIITDECDDTLTMIIVIDHFPSVWFFMQFHLISWFHLLYQRFIGPSASAGGSLLWSLTWMNTKSPIGLYIVHIKESRV